MRIVEPSCTILDELDQQSLASRIEYCGRICYKSEHRITEGSALPFARKIVENSHYSVLEMGAVTLRLDSVPSECLQHFFATGPRYLQVDQLPGNTLLVTGTIRAFRETTTLHPGDTLSQAMVSFLSARHAYFFAGLPLASLPTPPALRITKLTLDQVTQLAPALLARHRYLAVKFVVNRAVSHELVRHRPCAFLQESQRYCRYSSDQFGNEVSFIKPLFFAEDSKEFALWAQSMEEAEQRYLLLLQSASPQAARTVLPNSCKTEIIVHTNLAEWQHIVALRTSKAADPSMQEVMLPLQQQLQERFPAIFA